MRRTWRLERRLKRDRPRPRDEFESALTNRVAPEASRPRSAWRPALVGGLTALLVVAFAATGGIGYAAKSVQGGTTAVADLVTGPSSDSHPNNGNDGDNGNGNNGNANNGDNGNGNGNTSHNGTTTQTRNGSDPSGQSNAGGAGTTTICHAPPGNSDSPQTITIGDSAVADHLANHPEDTLGPCEAGGPPGDQYEEPVLICHRTDSETNPWVVISISVNALPAHKAHGDTLVNPNPPPECPGPPIP
jgi:hypothetical protein